MHSNSTNQLYHCIIIGGGLAGLSLSILLSQKKLKVLLIEKKAFPYHKVCGEYLSNESRNFLIRIGIPLNTLGISEIDTLALTSVSGYHLESELNRGGFGISRYTLDNLLAQKAKALGVHILESTVCNGYEKENDGFIIKTSKGDFKGDILCASFGRHAFGNFFKPPKSAEIWVGVKYHIEYEFAKNKIALHSFKNGYCGISNVEGNKCCICYLVKASQLNRYRNKIELFEKYELRKNPFLKEIFSNAVFLYDKPLTVSNITFEAKKPVYDGVFYIGDSAGSIAPLTGNGMSNALRSAFILDKELELYFKKELSRSQLEASYQKKWKLEFLSRIQKGRIIQKFFCNEILNTLLLKTAKAFPAIQSILIRQTHGKDF